MKVDGRYAFCDTDAVDDEHFDGCCPTCGQSCGCELLKAEREACARVAENIEGVAVCPDECGVLERVDEDGCCPYCGKDAMSRCMETVRKIAAAIRARGKG